MEPYRPRDASQLRISDADRHAVAETLRQAAGEGRIDITELQERLEATYQAKTYGDLVPITADLPVSGAPQPSPARMTPPPAGGPLVAYASTIAVMSETKRTGPWLVSDGHVAFALMGSVVLDLREAAVDKREITINASALMGEVKVIVDAGTTVVVDGFGVMGDFAEQRPKVPFDPGLGGPVLRLKGAAIMGGVHVQRRGRPGQSRRGRLGRSRG